MKALMRSTVARASATKPVGTVWFAWAVPSDSGPTLGADTAFVRTQGCHLDGDRASVRHASAQRAITGLLVVGPWLGHASWHAYRAALLGAPARVAIAQDDL